MAWIADYDCVVNLPVSEFIFRILILAKKKILASESGKEESAPTLISKSETIIGKWSARNLSCESHYSFKLWFPGFNRGKISTEFYVIKSSISDNKTDPGNRSFDEMMFDLRSNCVANKATLQPCYLFFDNNSRYSRILARITDSTDIIGIL